MTFDETTRYESCGTWSSTWSKRLRNLLGRPREKFGLAEITPQRTIGCQKDKSPRRPMSFTYRPWLYVWKPIITSSVQLAKERSIQGVRTLTDYFVPEPTTNTRPRHPNTRAHRTTRPQHKTQTLVLPPPAFHFRSL
jgi:hypothetical protein